ncbi:hypothetical protein O1L60_24240 [Streptomyces diastatochromogenes]|nr:hypothetical protein [Streptomyces diastatochromogenes]
MTGGVLTGGVALGRLGPAPLLALRQLPGSAPAHDPGEDEEEQDEQHEDGGGAEAAGDHVRFGRLDEFEGGERQGDLGAGGRQGVQLGGEARGQEHRRGLPHPARGAEDDGRGQPGAGGRQDDVPDRAPARGPHGVRGLPQRPGDEPDDDVGGADDDRQHHHGERERGGEAGALHAQAQDDRRVDEEARDDRGQRGHGLDDRTDQARERSRHLGEEDRADDPGGHGQRERDADLFEGADDGVQDAADVERFERPGEPHVLGEEVEVGEGLAPLPEGEGDDEDEDGQQDEAQGPHDDAGEPVADGGPVLVEGDEQRVQPEEEGVGDEDEADGAAEGQQAGEEQPGEGERGGRGAEHGVHVGGAQGAGGAPPLGSWRRGLLGGRSQRRPLRGDGHGFPPVTRRWWRRSGCGRRWTRRRS